MLPGYFPKSSRFGPQCFPGPLSSSLQTGLAMDSVCGFSTARAHGLLTSNPRAELLKGKVYSVGGSTLGTFGVTLRNTNSCRIFTPAPVPMPMSVLVSVVLKPCRLPAG